MVNAPILANKTLAMIVGPTSVGKSTVMREAVRQDPEFSYVRAFTTRPPRAGETTTYSHISHEEAAALQSNGQALTYVVHPTSGVVYGTTVESYTTKYNLLDTLANSVAAYQSLPFGQTLTISMTAPGNAWEQWFHKRYPVTSDEARQRLAEAKLSIKWSLQQPGMVWLVNELDDVAGTAARLIAICRGQSQGTTSPLYAESMLQSIDTLLS